MPSMSPRCLVFGGLSSPRFPLEARHMHMRRWGIENGFCPYLSLQCALALFRGPFTPPVPCEEPKEHAFDSPRSYSYAPIL